MTLSNNSRGLDNENILSCLKTVIKCSILENGFNMYTRSNSILIQTSVQFMTAMHPLKKNELLCQNQLKVIIKPKCTTTKERITIY